MNKLSKCLKKYDREIGWFYLADRMVLLNTIVNELPSTNKLVFFSDIFVSHTSDCSFRLMQLIGNDHHWLSNVLIDDLLDEHDILDNFWLREISFFQGVAADDTFLPNVSISFLILYTYNNAVNSPKRVICIVGMFLGSPPQRLVRRYNHLLILLVLLLNYKIVLKIFIST